MNEKIGVDTCVVLKFQHALAYFALKELNNEQDLSLGEKRYREVRKLLENEKILAQVENYYRDEQHIEKFVQKTMEDGYDNVMDIVQAIHIVYRHINREDVKEIYLKEPVKRNNRTHYAVDEIKEYIDEDGNFYFDGFEKLLSAVEGNFENITSTELGNILQTIADDAVRFFNYTKTKSQAMQTNDYQKAILNVLRDSFYSISSAVVDVCINALVCDIATERNHFVLPKVIQEESGYEEHFVFCFSMDFFDRKTMLKPFVDNKRYEEEILLLSALYRGDFSQIDKNFLANSGFLDKIKKGEITPMDDSKKAKNSRGVYADSEAVAECAMAEIPIVTLNFVDFVGDQLDKKRQKYIKEAEKICDHKAATLSVVDYVEKCSNIVEDLKIIEKEKTTLSERGPSSFGE